MHGGRATPLPASSRGRGGAAGSAASRPGLPPPALAGSTHDRPRSEGTLHASADDAVAACARACAVLVTPEILAAMGATLACARTRPRASCTGS
ncbi:hypothetical protein B5P19_10480 [Clavibacter sepedonicus]|nr:hypothetical protein B5P19_10480 [Clavibacter sepedonicus]OQJ54177.1 hypothetical protein B5P20_08665 [Clavibacter sepedonicus]